MNIIFDHLAALAALQKAAEQSPFDAQVQIPPLLLPVVSVPRFVQTNGGTAPRAAQDSFLWFNTFSRTNQAASEVNQVSLGPGSWRVQIRVNGFTDFALANTSFFAIDLMDGFASRDRLWSRRGTGAAAQFSDLIEFELSVKNLPNRDAVVFGNETSIIFMVPTAGVGQTNTLDFSTLAHRIF